MMSNEILDSTSRDEFWMRLALEEANKASILGEVPVGAVIVLNDKLIATGHNQPISKDDPTAHAEIVALREAAKKMGNYRLPGASLYVTLEPCVMCSGAMLHARLSRVIFGAWDPKTGAAGSIISIFAEDKLNHQTSVLGGVLAEDSSHLLKTFFQLKRKIANLK